MGDTKGRPGSAGLRPGQKHRLGQRIGREQAQIGRQQQRIGRQQARLGQGAASAPAPAGQGTPGAAGNKSGGAKPPATPAAAGGGAQNQAAAGQQGPKTFQDFINSTFGAGSPFGMRGNYSDPNNPIYDAARRNYQQGLAGTQARFGSAGLGNSSREALAEGEGAADFGAQIAQIGEQAFQNDAGRALQGALGGQQNLLNANAQLGNLGNQVTGIGAAEQQIPGLSGLMSFLSTFGPTLGLGGQTSRGGSGLFVGK